VAVEDGSVRLADGLARSQLIVTEDLVLAEETAGSNHDDLEAPVNALFPFH